MNEKWPRVQMHDFDFRKKMESGEVRLMRRDLLIVDLEVVQTITKAARKAHAALSRRCTSIAPISLPSR